MLIAVTVELPKFGTYTLDPEPSTTGSPGWTPTGTVAITLLVSTLTTETDLPL